jgi:hypothetical protein
LAIKTFALYLKDVKPMPREAGAGIRVTIDIRKTIDWFPELIERLSVTTVLFVSPIKRLESMWL